MFYFYFCGQISWCIQFRRNRCVCYFVVFSNFNMKMIEFVCYFSKLLFVETVCDFISICHKKYLAIASSINTSRNVSNQYDFQLFPMTQIPSTWNNHLILAVLWCDTNIYCVRYPLIPK